MTSVFCFSLELSGLAKCQHGDYVNKCTQEPFYTPLDHGSLLIFFKFLEAHHQISKNRALLDFTQFYKTQGFFPGSGDEING